MLQPITAQNRTARQPISFPYVDFKHAERPLSSILDTIFAKHTYMGRKGDPDELTVAGRVQAVIDAITQGNARAFAKKIGVTSSAVNQWQRGKSRPAPEALFRIEDETSYSARWVATGEGPKESATETFSAEVITLALSIAEAPSEAREKLKAALKVCDIALVTARPKTVVPGKHQVRDRRRQIRIVIEGPPPKPGRRRLDLDIGKS